MQIIHELLCLSILRLSTRLKKSLFYQTLQVSKYAWRHRRLKCWVRLRSNGFPDLFVTLASEKWPSSETGRTGLSEVSNDAEKWQIVAGREFLVVACFIFSNGSIFLQSTWLHLQPAARKKNYKISILQSVFKNQVKFSWMTFRIDSSHVQ